MNSSEYFTNNQAHGSNDRAFLGTSMQRHHQGFQDFSFFFDFNRPCIISESFSITTSDQPTTNQHVLIFYRSICRRNEEVEWDKISSKFN